MKPICRACKQPKVTSKCGPCRIAAQKRYISRMRETNPEVLKRWRKNTQKRQVGTVKFKTRRQKLRLVRMMGGCCSLCGYDKNLGAMDFDHRDPTTKKASVGLLLLGSFNKAYEEAKKCDLLCANCHRERTHPELVNPDAGSGS